MPFCTTCGRAVRSDQRFCTSCGNTLGRSSGTITVQRHYETKRERKLARRLFSALLALTATFFLWGAVSLASETRTPSNVTTETLAAIATVSVFIGGTLFLFKHGKSGRQFFELGGSSGFAGVVATVVRFAVFGSSSSDVLYVAGMMLAFCASLVAKKI